MVSDFSVFLADGGEAAAGTTNVAAGFAGIASFALAIVALVGLIKLLRTDAAGEPRST